MGWFGGGRGPLLANGARTVLGAYLLGVGGVTG